MIPSTDAVSWCFTPVARAGNMEGMTSEEKGTVLRLRSIMKGHVCGLCGDLQTPGMWRKYGAFNSVSEEFEFYPHW